MSEQGEVYKAMREHSAVKRRDNRANSKALLRERGVIFEEKNQGAHLIVRHQGQVVDFWPGTGRWMFRGIKAKSAEGQGRGVFSMLRELGIKGTVEK